MAKNTETATAKTTTTATKAAKPAAKVAAKVAKAKRLNPDEAFAKNVKKIRSTGNAQLDTVLQKIVTEIRENGIAPSKEGFAGSVRGIKVAVKKVTVGKSNSARYVMALGEGKDAVEIGAGFAAAAFRQATRFNRPKAAGRKVEYDAGKVADLAKALGL
jgi:hypothetical protein